MLTVEEIENISFRRSGIGGYRIEDVDTFVDGVIEKVRQLEMTNKELENRIAQLNKQILKHEEQADSVQDAIITAEITAKKIVRDASLRAEVMISDAKAKADNMIAEADEKSARTLSESDTRAQTILNSALIRSASSIDENNRIIEQQKQHIIRIQSEVTRFRDALIDSYKNHLKIINSLPKAEEFRQYQSKLEESYPMAQPVTPQSVEQDIREEADRAIEESRNEGPQIKVEMVNAEKVREISEEIRTNQKAQAVLDKEREQELQKAAAQEPVPSPETKDDVPEAAEKFVEETTEKAAEEMTEDISAAMLVEPEQEENPSPEEAPDETTWEDEPEKDKDAAEGKEEASSREEKAQERPDSNADEIREAVSADNSMSIKAEEKKPTSIDEIDDGVIFSSKEKEERFQATKNRRRPIRFSDDIE